MIKSCPFCGAKAKLLEPDAYGSSKIKHTKQCYFEGIHHFVKNDSRINKWNKRTKGE